MANEIQDDVETFKSNCDKCFESGNEIFAQVFYRKIDNEWKYICEKCWEIERNKDRKKL